LKKKSGKKGEREKISMRRREKGKGAKTSEEETRTNEVFEEEGAY